jgi:hypothetical protein
MSRRSWKGFLAIVALVVIGAGAIVYLFLPSAGNAITSEQEARASCEVALKSHLRDVKKEDEKWQITTVRFDPSTDRWFCTLAGDQGRKLFIILKPKTGGFEVSASYS